MVILTHELGTRGNRATLVDTDSGQTVAMAFEGYSTVRPRPNWAEQDPADWWRAVATTTRNVLEASGISPGDVAAVSFSGMLNSLLPVDRNGEPLRPAMIWADQRAADEANRLSRAVGVQQLYRRTGHRPGPGYAAARMLWIQRHQPDLYVGTHQFLQAKDYGAYKLTGVFAGDYSDASGTNLFDLERRDWATDLIEAVGLDRRVLPPIHPSTTVIGAVTAKAASETGLLSGTPVVIGGGSGACAAVGAGCVRPGDAYNYIGSSSWIAVTSERPLYDGQMRTVTFAHLDPRFYFPVGLMQASGGALDWLERLLRGEGETPIYDDLSSAAAQVEPGAKGLLFLPYLIGERSPHWNSDARGVFVGLGMGHGRAELTRAVMEGVAFNLKMILETFLELGTSITAVWLIGGGTRNVLWRQILADIYGLPIQRPLLSTEAKAAGAAIAAGVGIGLYPDLGVAHRFFQMQESEHPNPKHRRRYDTLYTLFRQTYAALEPIFKQLAAVQG